MAYDESGFTCYWRIENFVLFKKNSESVLTSPTFFSSRLASKFCLRIQDFEKDFLAIHLLRIRKVSNVYFFMAKVVTLNYSVSLLLKTGWATIVENARQKFVIDVTSKGVDRLVAWEKLEKEPWMYLPNGCLTVKFHVWNFYTEDSVSQCLINSRMLSRKELCHMPIKAFETLKDEDLKYFPSSYELKHGCKTKGTQTDVNDGKYTLHSQESILKFLQEKNLCFVNLQTSQEEFMVHKALLCASSPVFKAMFEQDMQENEKNVVQIDDVDSETMTTFIQFLHMESIDDLNWERTVKLYYVADKYQTEYLKKRCTSILKNKLTVQNICEAFNLADMHQNTDLKQSALSYFILNSKTILRSMEWKNFMLNNTELAADILHNSAEGLYQN